MISGVISVSNGLLPAMKTTEPYSPRHLPNARPKPVRTEGKDEKKKLSEYREALGGDKMVAFAIGFPGVKGAQNIKHYKANKIYYQQFMQDEPEDIEDNETIQ